MNSAHIPAISATSFRFPPCNFLPSQKLGSLAFQQPIVISRNGTVVDGYARWELARRQSKATILCLEYDLTDDEALHWLIQSHRPLRGLNAFCRTLLAQDLAPSLRPAARANQRIGGQSKGSSNLTEAQKVNVRSKTATIAGVCSGNVAKVEEVSKSAPTIQEALRSGEISVHKAWQWRRLSHQQQIERLEEYRSQKGTNQTSRRLIQKHVARLLLQLMRSWKRLVERFLFLILLLIEMEGASAKELNRTLLSALRKVRIS